MLIIENGNGKPHQLQFYMIRYAREPKYHMAEPSFLVIKIGKFSENGRFFLIKHELNNKKILFMEGKNGQSIRSGY
jgi:hypothetical protein